MDKIKLLANQYFNKTVEMYHHLHQHPELSGKEEQTANYVCQILDEIGIPYTSHVSGHGVVALLKGNRPKGCTVALRADMDALPIQEESGLPFSSEVPGVMHACGHDVHTASLLGALMILHDLRDEFGGTVKAIFQPSEEEYDGGAKFMIDDNVLENPKVDVIIGQHVTPGMEAGTIGLKSGPFMASTDEVHIRIIGKGGHAARPTETVNPIPVAAAIIHDLNLFIKAESPQDSPSILSFGKFIANGSTNIIPDAVEIAGTLRTFNEVWREEVCAYIRKTVKKHALSGATNFDLDIRHGYPVLVNNPQVSDHVRNYAVELLGKHNVVNLPPRLTAEDFAYYLQRRPGIFYRLGVSNASKGITQTTHSSTFQIDEESLRTSISLLSWIAIRELNNIN